MNGDDRSESADNSASISSDDDARMLVGLKRLLALKSIKRTGWLRAGVAPPKCESVADHAFYVVLYAALFADDSLDRATVLDMAIVHDLAEIVVGDLTPTDCPRAEKIERERSAMASICRVLPNGEKWRAVWEAYERQDSPEAKFVRAVDRAEMARQAALYAQDEGIDPRPFQASAIRDADPQVFERLSAAHDRLRRDFSAVSTDNP